MKSRFVISLAAVSLLISVHSLKAQENGSTVKPQSVARITKGVINSTAVSLTVPKYPAAARAVGATGEVRVKVVIDHDGRVFEAKVNSGHPLLRQACVAAAKTSKFRPTLLSGNPVEVEGIILYQFVGLWTKYDTQRLGFAIEYLKRNSDEFSEGVFWELKQSVPDDWTNERRELGVLADYFESLSAQNFFSERPIYIDPRGLLEKEASDGVMPDPVDDPLSFANSLDAKITARLKSEYVETWYYNVGQTAAETLTYVENDPDSMAIGISNVKELLAAAKKYTPASETYSPVLSTGRLEQIISEYENPAISSEQKRSKIASICRELGS